MPTISSTTISTNSALLKGVSANPGAGGPTSVPPGILALPAGTVLRGTITQIDGRGNAVFSSPKGEVSLQTELAIKLGSEVALRLTASRNGLSARILSINGMSPKEFAEQSAIPRGQQIHVDDIVQTGKQTTTPKPGTAPQGSASQTASASIPVTTTPASPAANPANITGILLQRSENLGQILQQLPSSLSIPATRLEAGTSLRLSIVPQSLQLPASSPSVNTATSPPSQTSATPAAPTTATGINPMTGNVAQAAPPATTQPPSTPAAQSSVSATPAAAATPTPATPTTATTPTAAASAIASAQAQSAATPTGQTTQMPPVPNTPASTTPQNSGAATPQPASNPATTASSPSVNAATKTVSNPSPSASTAATTPPQTATAPPISATPTPSTIQTTAATAQIPANPSTQASPQPVAKNTAPSTLQPQTQPLSATPTVTTSPTANTAVNTTNPQTPNPASLIPTSPNAAPQQTISNPTVQTPAPQTTTPAISAPKPTATQLTQGHIPAQVIGHERGGETILKTVMGTVKLTLPAASGLPSQPPVGTTLTLQLEAILPSTASSFATAGTTTPAPLSELSIQWRGLQETVEILAQTQPALAAQIIDTVIPKPGAKMAAEMLFFLTALKGGDIKQWLGRQAIETLEQQNRGELIRKLTGEFSSLRQFFMEPPSPNWQAAFLPVYDGQNWHQAHLFLRREPESAEDAEAQGTRFIMEVELSQMGPMQFDGLIKKRGEKVNFDLIIRSTNALSADDRQNIRDIYQGSSEITGLSGGISFQVANPFPVLPMQEILSDAPDVMA